ncbi:cofilin-related [Anaeramoeba flamelloides]|uniref:Cofilin-related n=1 Tax=Anaeramoeba flamelloides TaxID=1746091 RepID=A0ABQ8Z022_9EUKA|nr:cofilin-related [Anaeramoeba flamelloides]
MIHHFLNSLFLIPIVLFLFFINPTNEKEVSCPYIQFGNEYQANNYTASNQETPAIASIGANNERYLIAWASNNQDGSDNGIFSQMFDSDDGTKIGTEFQVNNYTTLDQKAPAIASVGANRERFVICWTSYKQDGYGNGIFSQMFDSDDGTKIGTEFQANNYTTSDQETPAIASIGASNERYLIAWTSLNQDGSGYGIFAQMFDSNSNGGNKIGNEFQVNNYTDSQQKSPAIASIGANNERFVIAWASNGQDGSDNGIYAQVFDSNSNEGTKIGSEFQVNNYTTLDQKAPAIASIGANRERFVICWQSDQQDGSGNGVYAQMFDSNSNEANKIGSEFQVNTFTDGGQQEPQIASIGANRERFVITWQSNNQDGYSYGVYGQVYDSNDDGGTKATSEFLVNTQTSDIQKSASISSIGARANGKEQFVISWQSLNQDGSGEGVYAQNYQLSAKPETNKQIADQYFENNNQFNFQFDQDIFIDPNTNNNNNNENLTYQAQLSNDQDLPNGLNFDSKTRQFSGSVSNYDSCQDWVIEIIANENQCNLSNHQAFQLLSANEKPETNNTIPDQELSYGLGDYSDFDFKVPKFCFFDRQENEYSLDYESTLENDDPLPEWLVFDNSNQERKFLINGNSQLTRNEMGNYQIKVIAKDYCNLTTSQIFNFQIINDSPYVNRPIKDLEMDLHDKRTFIFDMDTFLDPNDDDLTYTIKVNDNEDAPNWITFIENKRKITIDPKDDEENAGTFKIKIIASDGLLKTFDEFNLRINQEQSSSANLFSIFNLFLTSSLFLLIFNFQF